MTTLGLRDLGFLAGTSRASKVSLLLRGDYIASPFTILDSSQRAKTITAAGDATVSTTEFKYGNSSLQFDGNGDYFTSPANADFDFGSGDFTIECWVNLNSLSTDQTFISYAGGTTGTQIAFGLERVASNSSFRLFYYAGSTPTVASCVFSIVAGQWYHVAAVRVGGQLRCYVDGTGGTAVTALGSLNTASGRQLIVGAYHTTLRFVNGFIDDVRLVKGLGVYTSNFTPPPADFPDVS